MAQENVEVIREMLDAVTDRDPDRFLACLTADVIWDDREGWPGIRRVYHGRTGVRKWLDAFMSTAELVDAEVEELGEVSSGRVLLGVYGRFRGGSGTARTEFDARAWYVFWLVNGKVSRAQLFWARDEALKASGLVEPSSP